MSAQTLLSGGDKWFSYSGVTFGDVSVPATIQLNFIPNTGLRDSYVVVQAFYGLAVSGTGTAQLGIIIKINDTEVVKFQGREYSREDNDTFNLFVPRQSKLEVLSINTSGNNTQERGANILGYYL
jgi:hypothetical protein